jgi:DNA-directed RNA polymerase subunit N (RpoN/RPB10)
MRDQVEKRKYENSIEWRRFARRAQRNPHMKRILHELQHGRCKLCCRLLDVKTMQIHHLDYDHTCSYPGEVVLTSQSGRHRTVPDCASCHAALPDVFAECLRRLALTHQRCNQAAG